jgi:hypothetical protein
MKCKVVDDMLVTYLDGEVTPLEKAEIEAHLAVCPACVGELAALRAVGQQVGATLQAVAAMVAPSPQAWARLQARLSPQPQVWPRGVREKFRIVTIASRLKWRWIYATGAVVLLLLLVGAWWFMWERPPEVSAREVLNWAATPRVPTEIDGVLHIQHTAFELEGVPPEGGYYQPLQTTFELWIDGHQPNRARQTIVDDPGGLRYAKVSDGVQVWEYGLGDRQQAVKRSPTEEETLAGLPTPFLSLQANPKQKFLQEALAAAEAKLRYLGTEELKPWGTVHRVAYEWDGVTAITDRYKGLRHTILFKISDKDHWLVEWQDIVHAAAGDVLHRNYRLESWEVLSPTAVPPDLFTFTPPAGVIVQTPEELAQATQAPPATEDTISLAGFTVKRLPFTPWLPTYLPEGLHLKSVKEAGGQYMLEYRDQSTKVSLRLNQKPRLRYNWGNTPEIVELPEATMELGSMESLLIARVQLKAAGLVPDFIIITTLGHDELTQVIRSLQPVE